MDEPAAPQTVNTNIVHRIWHQEAWYYSIIDMELLSTIHRIVQDEAD